MLTNLLGWCHSYFKFIWLPETAMSFIIFWFFSNVFDSQFLAQPVELFHVPKPQVFHKSFSRLKFQQKVSFCCFVLKRREWISLISCAFHMELFISVSDIQQRRRRKQAARRNISLVRTCSHFIPNTHVSNHNNVRPRIWQCTDENNSSMELARFSAVQCGLGGEGAIWQAHSRMCDVWFNLWLEKNSLFFTSSKARREVHPFEIAKFTPETKCTWALISMYTGSAMRGRDSWPVVPPTKGWRG